MSKELEALRRLKWDHTISIEERIELCEYIEKDLKALDILKSKLSPLTKSTFFPMTQEEFNLLNEVINDEH